MVGHRAIRIFITATDTGVGKTMTTLALGLLLQEQGYQVGVLKPVQCAGDDAAFLKKHLQLDDPLAVINPIFVPEPLSPHLALKRAKCTFNLTTIKHALAILEKKYDIILIEGAGGLMVPLTDNYYTVDLIRDLRAKALIVSRRGLGSINHTLLTINQLKVKKIPISGLIFCDHQRTKETVASRTNPDEIARLSGIRKLGTVPYFATFTKKTILSQCQLTLPI